MSDANQRRPDHDPKPMFQAQFQSTTGAGDDAKKAAGASLLSGYQPGAGAFDEFLATKGEVYPHYEKLLGQLEEFGNGEMQRRADASQRFVHEHGITYNVYGDPRGMERPWQLDPIPFVIAPDEWHNLETGLIQRAKLLNRILADCYSGQDLIRSRWLSPALIFGQPDFLRPCHGIRVPGDNYLHFYAADLSRSPDGRWWVVSDRTQIPTGAGYALANRLVTSRILPESFRDNHVHRLAGFFLTAQNSLAQLAPRQADKARVVMLTPGPHNETYFEQAYLARYLGYMLVEGQDLTVRDNHVFLKTLSGLERVDVILRRVDDDFCDPLELRNDSILGVPGLVEAVRAGNVIVTNALGSGLVQSPAFMSFLPGLCEHLLGETLKLPSVATWWCGQQSAREHVLKNLDSLVVKPAFRTHLKIANAERNELKQRIEFDPDLFVAQEQVELSTAPSWKKDSLVAQPISLRVFLVADGKGGYCVMPGGLVRIAPDNSGSFISMQRGGSSKDTWIPSATPVAELTLLHASGQSVELRRTGNNLPSRLADNFFWLGRYSERADATSRFLRSALLRFNPERASGARSLLSPLLLTLETQGQLPGISNKPELLANAEAFEAELLAAIFAPDRPGSLRQTAEQLHRLAMLVRDRTSNDMWRVLSQIDDRLATPTTSLVMLSGDAVGILNQTLLGLAAFHGLARENMTRAQAWRFLDMGLRLERAVYLCTLLNATLHSADAENPSLLEAVLEVVDCSITFRSRYNLLPTIPAVFDLVLLDDKNPRSVLFQIKQLVKHFERLPKERGESGGAGKMILMNTLQHLERSDARELTSPPEKWADSGIAAAIKETLQALPQLSDAIAASYFAHSAISRTGRGDAS
ncbi:MAG: circularly permuted type 2 ATP-grasp protein [Verrucomicrobiota bacterium]